MYYVSVYHSFINASRARVKIPRRFSLFYTDAGLELPGVERRRLLTVRQPTLSLWVQL